MDNRVMTLILKNSKDKLEEHEIKFIFAMYKTIKWHFYFLKDDVWTIGLCLNSPVKVVDVKRWFYLDSDDEVEVLTGGLSGLVDAMGCMFKVVETKTISYDLERLENTDIIKSNTDLVKLYNKKQNDKVKALIASVKTNLILATKNFNKG